MSHKTTPQDPHKVSAAGLPGLNTLVLYAGKMFVSRLEENKVHCCKDSWNMFFSAGVTLTRNQVRTVIYCK